MGSANGSILAGKAEITAKTWHHVALVHTARRVTVYLDGDSEPEIDRGIDAIPVNGPRRLSIGGRNDGGSAFEGKIDEVAVYDRALTAR